MVVDAVVVVGHVVANHAVEREAVARRGVVGDDSGEESALVAGVGAPCLRRRMRQLVAHDVGQTYCAVDTLVAAVGHMATEHGLGLVFIYDAVDYDIHLVAHGRYGCLAFIVGLGLRVDTVLEETALYAVPPLAVVGELAQLGAAERAHSVDVDLRLQPWHEAVGHGSLGDVGAAFGAQAYAVGRNSEFHAAACESVRALDAVEYAAGGHGYGLGHHHHGLLEVIVFQTRVYVGSHECQERLREQLLAVEWPHDGDVAVEERPHGREVGVLVGQQ